MNTVQVNSALLCDSEVLRFLQESTKRRSSKQKRQTFQDLRTVEYEVTGYLSELPCSSQTEEQVSSFLVALETWPLTKAEKLQLLNLRPTSLIEIGALVEECVRFTEDKLEELLQVLDATVPYSKPVSDSADQE
ncbi:hypothetical protein BSLG_001038 [Batrachochytrium salamandrivorans]|nr:hypothetical protein BSLG_001038 [Batrachochytrium salamandrivorans]